MANKTSKYWDKRALQRLTDAEKLSEEHIKRVKDIYKKAFRDIEKDIQDVYRNYSKDTGLDIQKLKTLLSAKETDKVWKTLKRQGLDKYIKGNYKARISRLEKIQAQIYAKAKQIYPKEELEHTMAYKGVINDSYYKAVYDTQMGTGHNFSFSKIDDNLEKSLLSERWSGKNYSQRIWGNTDILADSLADIIGSGLLNGRSIQKMTKDIKDRFNVGQYYAERLIRTETNHFHNQADAMAYEEMGVEYYVFVATLDNRTSEICQNMDGKKFAYKDKVEGENYPPLHPNCRSKTRGYIDEDTEKELKRRARNPITGKNEIIDNITYKEWAEKNGLNKKRADKQSVKSKVKASKSVKNEAKKGIFELNDLPNSWLYAATDKQHAEVLVNYLNKIDSDETTAKLYKSIGKIKDIDKVEIDYTSRKKSFSVLVNTYTGKVSHLEVNNPKLYGLDNPAGAVQTTLHEDMHVMDFMLKGADNTNYMSTSSSGLKMAILEDDGVIGDKSKELFNRFDTEARDIRTRISKENNYKYDNLNQRFSDGEISYKTYRGYWSKTSREIDELINYEIRNNYNGVSSLEDIYDALSKGKAKDKRDVWYGHGSKYYDNGGIDSQAKEILANYGALKMTRQDLVEILKEDKPKLVAELDKLIEEMLKEANK